jgi:hypothetical protein
MTMKPKHWMSKRLERHQNKLRQRALKEREEDKRKDYWSLYYDAKAIEHEFVEKQMMGDIERIVEVITVLGVTDVLLEAAQDNPPPEDEPKQPDSKPSDSEDNIPPRQMGFWE